MTRAIRIGTRGSELALWQAGEVARRLTAAGYEPHLVTVKTTGDKRQDVSLATIGGKGLFIKELEEALDRDEVDLAVHSLKDVPSIISERFTLAAFLERADPRDVWVHPAGQPIASIAGGSVIGTSAPRRRAQLAMLFPHLHVEDIRGNVDTRIEKARSGACAGIVLASAGLTRLGRESEITSYFSPDEMVPAAGQGVIVVECRADDAFAEEATARIDHEPTHVVASCERGVLERFGEQLDCYSAVAVHAIVESGSIDIQAFIAGAGRTIKVRHSGSRASEVVAAVYGDLASRGAEELLCATRS